MKDMLNEVKSLMKRIDVLPGNNTNFINEVSCKWRNVIGEENFFDFLSSLKPGNMVTFGYVSSAKIEVPKGKRLNPVTNRMNQFDDYETLGKNLGEQGSVINVIKLTIYNFPWQGQEDVASKYSDWKTKRDELGSKYGVEFGKARYATQANNLTDKNPITSYGGENDELKTHTYTNLNMSRIKPLSTTYYLVFADGKIKPIDVSKLTLLPYTKSTSAIDKLRNAGATEEDVQPLLGMQYQRFEHSHVLFVSATPDDGIPTLLINNKLSDKIGGISGVDTNELIAIAKERYSKFICPDVNFVD